MAQSRGTKRGTVCTTRTAPKAVETLYMSLLFHCIILRNRHKLLEREIKQDTSKTGKGETDKQFFGEGRETF